MNPTIRSIIQQASCRLLAAGIDTPRLDAELLLMHVADINRETLIFDDALALDDAQAGRYEQLLLERIARKPLSHIIGMREFYGRDFKVNEHVLDPRADSETLIDAVLKYAGSKAETQNLRMLDIGTGSGCLAITLLSELAGSSGVALDISQQALSVAQHNASQHGLSERLNFLHADMMQLSTCKALSSQAPFDIIISNPPYIPEADIAELMPEVQHYEPHLALIGGKDGLDCYRELATSTSTLLKQEGLLCIEIGVGQTRDIANIFSRSHWQLLEVYSDLAGLERCLTLGRSTI